MPVLDVERWLSPILNYEPAAVGREAAEEGAGAGPSFVLGLARGRPGFKMQRQVELAVQAYT